MKYLFSYSVNVVLVVISYFALIDNQIWAINLLKFYIWLVFIFNILGCFVAKKFSEKKFREGKPVKRTIPLWITLPIDLTVLCLIVAKGWAFLGVLYLLAILLDYAAIETAKKHYEELQSTQQKEAV